MLLLLLLLLLALSFHLVLLRSLIVEHLIDSLSFRGDGIVLLPRTLFFVGSNVFFVPHRLLARTMHALQYRYAFVDRAVV